MIMCHVRVNFVEKKMRVSNGCLCTSKDERQTQPRWNDEWMPGPLGVWGWGACEGLGDWGVEICVTDCHLVSVARAVRVVPMSAQAFDGLSSLFFV